MVTIFLFILGACIGSFLNVLIDRLPFDKSPLKGRSYCDNCKKTLKWYDLIPVLSFVLLQGKCRYCRKHVSYYYPLVEIVTGIMFVMIFAYAYRLSTTDYRTIFTILPYYLFVVSSLIVVFFADLKYGIIPDKIVLPAVIMVAIYHLSSIIFHFPVLNNQSSIINYLLSAFFSFLFFLFLHLITRGKGMGFGDVKLAFLIGLILGFPHSISAFYIAFLTGAFVGIILIIWKKKRLAGGKVPFGPFMVLGTLVGLFCGSQILQMVSLLF